MTRFIVMLIALMPSIIGCGDDQDKFYKPQERNSPRVIAVEPKPGSKPTEAVELTLRQEISITFNEPIFPNSGRIMFGSRQFGSRSAIQLQDTDATDVITWNICFRQLGLEPDTLVVSDFQNVNGDVQPHAFVGWYWMSLYDIGPPRIIEYYPTGHEVDPETTRGIRIVFEKPMGEVFCEITPAITLNPARIENDSIKSCTGIVTWEFFGTEQLDYSTKYDVKIEASDLADNLASDNFSFTTRAAPL